MNANNSLKQTGESADSLVDRTVFWAFLLMLLVVPLALALSIRPSVLKWFVIQTVAPVLATAWIVHRIVGKRFTIRWSFITIAALAILAAQFISLAPAVNRPLVYIEISKNLGLLAAYFLAANCMGDETDRDRVLWTVAICGCIAALYGGAQHFGFDFFPWQEVPEVPISRGVSTFGHANFAAHFLILAIPLTIGLMATRQSLWPRLIVLAFALAMLYHLLITGTRGAALGIAAAVAAVAVVLIRGRADKVTQRQQSARKQAAGWSAVAAAVALVLLGSVVVFSAWRAKRSDVFAIEEGSGFSRFYTWRTAARLFVEHPAFGIGAGNYEVVSPSVWNNIEVKRFVDFNKMSYRVHNEYLESAVEQGLIGFVALVGLMAAAVFEAYRVARFARDPDGRIHGLALLAAAMALAVDSMFNFDLQTPASALLFWVILGMITWSSVQVTQVRQIESSNP